jgi:hypothetical protein
MSIHPDILQIPLSSFDSTISHCGYEPHTESCDAESITSKNRKKNDKQNGGMHLLTKDEEPLSKHHQKLNTRNIIKKISSDDKWDSTENKVIQPRYSTWINDVMPLSSSIEMCCNKSHSRDLNRISMSRSQTIQTHPSNRHDCDLIRQISFETDVTPTISNVKSHYTCRPCSPSNPKIPKKHYHHRRLILIHEINKVIEKINRARLADDENLVYLLGFTLESLKEELNSLKSHLLNDTQYNLYNENNDISADSRSHEFGNRNDQIQKTNLKTSLDQKNKKCSNSIPYGTISRSQNEIDIPKKSSIIVLIDQILSLETRMENMDKKLDRNYDTPSLKHTGNHQSQKMNDCELKGLQNTLFDEDESKQSCARNLICSEMDGSHHGSVGYDGKLSDRDDSPGMECKLKNQSSPHNLEMQRNSTLSKEVKQTYNKNELKYRRIKSTRTRNIKVRATEDLGEGFLFVITVEGEAFIFPAPTGGVKKGEIFMVPIKKQEY